jgi:hypothetical protein
MTSAKLVLPARSMVTGSIALSSASDVSMRRSRSWLDD